MIINGIEVKVTRKKIKNAHLYVKPPVGDVEVTCPLNYSDDSVRLFVITNIGWIKRRIESFSNQPRQSKREFVSGETVYLFGKQYFLQVDYDEKKYDISINGDKIIFVVRKESTLNQREAMFNKWYRECLKNTIDPLLEKISEKTGLKCSGYLITNMKSKWGSCNTRTNKINFNLQLVKVPYSCIEYVILHELAHTVEKNHNSSFIAILDKYMPSWREIRDLLNNQTIGEYNY